MKNNFDLRGKVALITGAAGLLGYEHSMALLESGSSIIITDVNKKKLLPKRRTTGRCFGDDENIRRGIDYAARNRSS